LATRAKNSSLDKHYIIEKVVRNYFNTDTLTTIGVIQVLSQPLKQVSPTDVAIYKSQIISLSQDHV
jgi:hypothetical protein